MNELELFRTDVPEQCTPEQARDLTDRIKLVLDGMWELVKAAYTSRAWSALGYLTWDEYCTREFGTSRIRLPREDRGEVIGSLRDSGLSLRAIASATGLGRGTIERELATSGVPDGTPEVEVTRAPAADSARPESSRATPKPQPAQGEMLSPAPTSVTAPAQQRPVTKGLDGKTYRPSRPASLGTPTPPSSVSAPLFPEPDSEVVDAEIVDDVRREAELDAAMEGTDARFRRNFSAALARADDVWQFDLDRVAELYASDFEQDLRPWLEEMTRWADRVTQACRRNRTNLRVVSGGQP